MPALICNSFRGTLVYGVNRRRERQAHLRGRNTGEANELCSRVDKLSSRVDTEESSAVASHLHADAPVRDLLVLLGHAQFM
jgi:hypothetical protein